MSDTNTPTKGGKDAATTPNGKTPTSADAMFFFMIVKNMKSKADIDWAGVATDHGFKNAEVAKVRFGQVKRKLGIGENSTPTKKTPTKSTTPKEPKVKKTPTGRTGTKGKKEKKADGDKNVKMEDIPDSQAADTDAEDDAEAQLQADMDKYINPDPVEPFF